MLVPALPLTALLLLTAGPPAPASSGHGEAPAPRPHEQEQDDDWRPDAWITMKTKMALLAGLGVEAGAIHVDTRHGEVVLHGRVPSGAQRERAASAARDVEGVRDVRNLVQVVPEEHAEAVEAADGVVGDRVERALARDAWLEPFDVSVASVHDGVVLLEGRVPTVSDQLRAVRVAADVPGVDRVEHEIELGLVDADPIDWQLLDEEIVRPAEWAETGERAVRDAWITTELKLSMMASDELGAFDVNVDTRDSVVTLFGTVPDDEARHAAVALARAVDGVRWVRDELQVLHELTAEAKSDAALREGIEQALERFEHLEDVDVEVADRVVRLTGQVPTQVDRVAASTIARGTPGTRRVVDETTIGDS